MTNRLIEEIIRRTDGSWGDWPANDVPLTDIISWFQDALEEIPENHRHTARCTISSETDYDWHQPTITITYTRPETAKEVAHRKEAAAAERRNQRIAEIATLRALRAKHPDA